jgi:hypothetical protein
MRDVTGIPEIVIHNDYVLICGQRVQRPSAIAPSQWLKFWESRR